MQLKTKYLKLRNTFFKYYLIFTKNKTQFFKNFKFIFFYRVTILKKNTNIYLFKFLSSVNSTVLEKGLGLTQLKLFLEEEIHFRITVINFALYAKLQYMVYFFIFEDWCMSQSFRRNVNSDVFYTEDILKNTTEKTFNTDLISRSLAPTNRNGRWKPLDTKITLTSPRMEWCIGFFKTPFVLHNRT